MSKMTAIKYNRLLIMVISWDWRILCEEIMMKQRWIDKFWKLLHNERKGLHISHVQQVVLPTWKCSFCNNLTNPNCSPRNLPVLFFSAVGKTMEYQLNCNAGALPTEETQSIRGYAENSIITLYANQGLKICNIFSSCYTINLITPAFKLGISMSKLFLGFSPDWVWN